MDLKWKCECVEMLDVREVCVREVCVCGWRLRLRMEVRMEVRMVVFCR